MRRRRPATVREFSIFPLPHPLHNLIPLKISSKYIREQWEEDADAVTDVDVGDVGVEEADVIEA